MEVKRPISYVMRATWALLVPLSNVNQRIGAGKTVSSKMLKDQTNICPEVDDSPVTYLPRCVD